METKPVLFVIVGLSIVIVAILWSIILQHFPSNKSNLVIQKDKLTESFLQLLADENMKDIVVESKLNPLPEINPLTQEDTQTLVKNDIVTQREAESLLKLEKLLSPESNEKER